MYTLAEKEKNIILGLINHININKIDEMKFVIGDKTFELYMYDKYIEMSITIESNVYNYKIINNGLKEVAITREE